MRTALVLPLALWLSACQLFAAIPADDGIRGRKALGAELKQLLAGENFSQLEARAAAYAEHRETLADGWWKLTEFFIGLSEPVDKKDEAAWQAHLGHLEHWVAANPASETALTAQGAAFTRYGWAARGGGYANTVTEEGWRLFTDRLAFARNILLSARKRAPAGHRPGAGWYSAMLTVALGQGWPRPEYEQLFAEAAGAHPDYYEFYLKKGTYLLPRWNGAEGEWQQFARDSGRQLGPDVMARICWANGSLEGFDNLFAKCGITWAELGPGFAELRRKYPESAWTLNFYCRLACAARQRAVAAQLFREIGEDYFPEAWPSRESYAKSRAWALHPANP